MNEAEEGEDDPDPLVASCLLSWGGLGGLPTKDITETEDELPVLIAGGGMVGLSLATFLAEQGIPSLAVERLASPGP